MSNQRKSCGFATSGVSRSSGRLLGLLSAILMILHGLIAGGVSAGESRSLVTASLLRANCVKETGRHDAPAKDVAHHCQCCITCNADETGEAAFNGGAPAGVAAVPEFGGSILVARLAQDICERLAGRMTSWSPRAPPLFPPTC